MPKKKYIVTNEGPLQKKYLQDLNSIKAALTTLVAADGANGITTTVVYMDDPTQMSSLNATVITNTQNMRQAKLAIDSLFTSQNPDFVTIFGAWDVVVLQQLVNPMGQDGDSNVPSDLPYACTAPYSTAIRNFLLPTRDITRIPDMVGGTDSTYPIRVLSNATDQRQNPLAVYNQYFGITTKAWKNSTTTSVNNIYGSSANLNISPPTGPKWSVTQLQEMSFFFNLHGGSKNPNFYNDDGNGNSEICFTSDQASLGLSPNMAISVEACYGAQLYDPDKSSSKKKGICSASVYAGCCGYFGSTNIAYGPASGQGQADIITQKFLIRLFEGKSIGQATLEARIDFISASDMTIPSNLKTIGQFLVFGNGGFVPVKMPSLTLINELEEKGIYIMPKNLKSENERRARELANSIESSELVPDHPIPETVQNAIDIILSRRNFEGHSVAVHRVVPNEYSAVDSEEEIHIYTVYAIVGQRPFGADARVYHIRATGDQIIQITQTETK